MADSEHDAPLVVLRDVIRIHGRRGSESEVRALDGINLTIESGEYVAVTGESGSGKTTLLHLLCALDRPTSGHIRIGDVRLEAASSARRAMLRARGVGIVFQGSNLIPSLDALANVELASHYARVRGPAARTHAISLLKAVGLGDRLHHLPSELSGGQQQRVAIARALVNGPALLLADEPTGELDAKNTEIVLNALEQFNRESRQTLVVVTHSEAVWPRAARVIRLADGRIVEERVRR